MNTRGGGCRQFPLTTAKTVIGRGRDCSLRIALLSVSHQHCEIVLTDDRQFVARDLGTDSGTHVNSKPISEAKLEAGDELTIGPVTFILIIDGEPSETIQVRTLLTESEAV